MMESLPEGERKQEAQTVIDDVRAGFIAPDKARELIRVKRDPAMTETNTVVSIGDGKVAKVINKKVGNDTVKVYLDPTSGKEFPVTAEMLQSKQEITKKGWPSSASTKFVEDLVQSSSTIKDYVFGDTGWYTSDAEEEEMFNRRIELAAKVEELKQEGLTPPEVKKEILKFIGKDNGEAASILSEADRILEGM
jgi:hypothetical protein